MIFLGAGSVRVSWRWNRELASRWSHALHTVLSAIVIAIVCVAVTSCYLRCTTSVFWLIVVVRSGVVGKHARSSLAGAGCVLINSCVLLIDTCG